MLFLFLLFAFPSTPACVLYLDRLPVVSDYVQVCPMASMLSWENYDLRLVNDLGQTMCIWNAGLSLTTVPCIPKPDDNYHIQVWQNSKTNVCSIRAPELTEKAVATQCPDWLTQYQAGMLEIRGPYEISTQVPDAAPACTLPRVDNSFPISTVNDYKFLSGRLTWWGIDISPLEWQNHFDEQILGAADAAGVPAALLKAMIAQESQFWPLWTGETGEVGWMQLTWDGADTALRHSPELFDRFCSRGIWGNYCTGYDLLTIPQQDAIKTALLKDLTVSDSPWDAAQMASADLWTYAHILQAFACYASEIYPDRETWRMALVLYNAGTACIQGDSICPIGQNYLNGVLKWRYSHPSSWPFFSRRALWY
jgi:hypothetical protein